MKATDRTIFRQLEAELARAEAVVHAGSGNRKLHEPTVDNYRGQILAIRKALALLEMEETSPSGPIELNKQINITVSWRALFLITILGAFVLL